MEYVIYKDHEAGEYPFPHPAPCHLPLHPAITDHDIRIDSPLHCQKRLFHLRKLGSGLNRCSMLGY